MVNYDRGGGAPSSISLPIEGAPPLKVMCPAIASNSAGGNKKHVIFHVITFNVEMRQPLLLSASACALLCEASISCDQFCITMELTNHNPIF